MVSIKKDKGVSIFEWGVEQLERAFDCQLPANVIDALKTLGAPKDAYPWLARLQDKSLPLKPTDEPVPDLESRNRKSKRQKGQFYTPEHLAATLFDKVKPHAEHRILDPSCGDGSFLLAAVEQRSELEKPDLSLLCGYDIDKHALFICLIRLLIKAPGCGWPDLRNDDFLLCDHKDKFDLVIGNPPYKVNLAEDIKTQLCARYKTAEGEKDLYTFFMEAGINRLNDNANLVLLTSHTYLVNHQCNKIRELIFADNRAINLYLLPERFFAAAPGVLPVVLHLQKANPAKDEQIRVHTGYDGDQWRRQFVASAVSMTDCTGLRRAIVPKDLQVAFNVMESSKICMGDICKISVGIQESVRRSGKVSRFVADSKDSSQHEKVLRGREIEAFRVNWTGKFIDYGPHLAYKGDRKLYEGPKILYQNIRNERLKIRVVAALDEQGHFPKNSLSCIKSLSEDYSLEFIEGVLNSHLVNAWFSGQFHSFHITVTQMRQVPVPKYDEKAFARVIKCARRVKALVAGTKTYIKAMNDLDQAVCCCYLGDGDHTELRALLHNFLEQAACL